MTTNYTLTTSSRCNVVSSQLFLKNHLATSLSTTHTHTWISVSSLLLKQITAHLPSHLYEDKVIARIWWASIIQFASKKAKYVHVPNTSLSNIATLSFSQHSALTTCTCYPFSTKYRCIKHISSLSSTRLFHIMLKNYLLCHSLMLLNVAYYAIDSPLLFHVMLSMKI